MADYSNISMIRAELGHAGFLAEQESGKNQSFADKTGMKMFHVALKSSGTTLMTDKDVVLNS